MLILAVDDETTVAEMIREILEQEGHGCVIAGSVSDADWILRAVTVDATLLDFTMPGRPPLDWLEDLARADPLAAGRTVVMTGHRLDDGTIRRIRACGATLLQKPFGIDELLEAVRDRSRRSDPLADATPRAARPAGMAAQPRRRGRHSSLS